LFSNSSGHRNSAAQNLSLDSTSLLFGISVASVPSLLVFVVMQSVSHHLEQLGVGSEEVFRGDRLPILPFPDRS
jgi:hypothetical protein